MPKTIAELNQELLDLIDDVTTQPIGTVKTFTFKEKNKKLYGVDASEKAAQYHAKSLCGNNLKTNFEELGVQYQIAPALLAGMGSRESGMGTTTEKSSSIYWGWGDLRNGEYNGFGILQVDRYGVPFASVKAELKRAYGKTKLNPYEKRWLEWGVKTFINKLDKTRNAYADLASADQFATALSQYNGGKGLQYPKNDQYTTGHDYANDTLVRARWYAENWETIKC